MMEEKNFWNLDQTFVKFKSSSMLNGVIVHGEGKTKNSAADDKPRDTFA